jgi:alpha-tubulin suppressor-like RCC1 family protein
MASLFTVVSDSVLTVRVDAGGAVSAASAAAMDVEFFVNGKLFRSSSEVSRLRVTLALARVTPSLIYTGTEGTLKYVSSTGFGILSCDMGLFHSCAIMIGGIPFCWGADTNGKIGPTPQIKVTVPLAGFTSPVVLVSAGWQHTCAITSNNDAFCFGSNAYGQLGDGSYASSSRPVLVRGGHKWIHIYASHLNTCGVTLQGVVYCWGWDGYGLLGSGAVLIGSAAGSRPIPNPVVTLSSKFAMVSCAYWTCCALQINGQLWCWGDSTNGERGVGLTGTTSGSGVPRRLILPNDAESTFISVSGGYYFFCAISIGFRVWCWGDSSYSQCGIPNSAAGNLPNPNLVPGTPVNASVITAGAQHACASNSSIIVCWGGNQNGQLGDGSAFTNHHPPSVVSLTLAESETITSVSSHRGWSGCAVSSFNRMFVWGSGGNYMLADGNNGDSGVPLPVSSAFPGSALQIGTVSNFDSISWGERSTFTVHAHFCLLQTAVLWPGLG